MCAIHALVSQLFWLLPDTCNAFHTHLFMLLFGVFYRKTRAKNIMRGALFWHILLHHKDTREHDLRLHGVKSQYIYGLVFKRFTRSTSHTLNVKK